MKTYTRKELAEILSNTKVIYIAGPMTGLADYNKPAFDAAHVKLADSWVVINPSNNFGGDQTLEHSQYMRYSIHQLLISDAVYMLKGWMESTGARVEYEVSLSLGLEVHFE